MNIYEERRDNLLIQNLRGGYLERDEVEVPDNRYFRNKGAVKALHQIDVRLGLARYPDWSAKLEN